MQIGSTNYAQLSQMKKMDENYGANANMSRMIQDTISKLPEESQTDIKSFMKSLDESEKKDIMTKMNQIDSSNMSVDDLIAAIMDIYKEPSQTTQKSSYPSSFSVYP